MLGEESLSFIFAVLEGLINGHYIPVCFSVESEGVAVTCLTLCYSFFIWIFLSRFFCVAEVLYCGVFWVPERRYVEVVPPFGLVRVVNGLTRYWILDSWVTELLQLLLFSYICGNQMHQWIKKKPLSILRITEYL